MKRLSLAIIFACCTLVMAAQDAIRVNHQGAKPTFSDFITAYLAPTYGEDGGDLNWTKAIPSHLMPRTALQSMSTSIVKVHVSS